MGKRSSTAKEVKELLKQVPPEFRQELRGANQGHVYVYSPTGEGIAHGSLQPGSPRAVGTFKQRLKAIGALPKEA